MPQLPCPVSQHCAFDGQVVRWSHDSNVLDCEMHFSTYLPPAAEQGPVPVLFWLSGLTCSDENFTVKAGAQRFAAQQSLAIVAPDTSPRGSNTPGEDDAWNLGTGAGFYLNATRPPWNDHYRMEDYVAGELFDLAAMIMPLDVNRAGISGHSMGGHGALVLGLRHPDRFRSISAFSPICAPSQCPWGQLAFSEYLGDDPGAWQQYDATELVRNRGGPQGTPILIDQGEADEFLVEQLRPGLLEQACQEVDHPIDLRVRPGYDHSYFFVASFIRQHIEYHAARLRL